MELGRGREGLGPHVEWDQAVAFKVGSYAPSWAGQLDMELLESLLAK